MRCTGWWNPVSQFAAVAAAWMASQHWWRTSWQWEAWCCSSTPQVGQRSLLRSSQVQLEGVSVEHLSSRSVKAVALSGIFVFWHSLPLPQSFVEEKAPNKKKWCCRETVLEPPQPQCHAAVLVGSSIGGVRPRTLTVHHVPRWSNYPLTHGHPLAELGQMLCVTPQSKSFGLTPLCTYVNSFLNSSAVSATRRSCYQTTSYLIFCIAQRERRQCMLGSYLCTMPESKVSQHS